MKYHLMKNTNCQIENTTFSKLACVFGALLLLANPATAAVSVNGTTLSWSDDGWYQVQRSDDFSTICEGGTQCDVEPGNYIAINHSTGERFENIQVVGNDATDSQELQVNGNVISWPDDGWYQVQNASDYATVCEGGLQCSVEAGSYIVINHTTGQRYNDIQIGEGSTGTTPETSSQGVAVNDGLITWPDNGWYQVQYADTYQTVCEGGLQCQVSTGDFIVINHNTGIRTNISVSAEETTSDFSRNINIENAADLVEHAFEIYTGRAIDQRLLNAWSVEVRENLMANLTSEQPDSVEGVNRVYSCENGGTASETQYQEDFTIEVYDVTFDNCQIGADLINGGVVRIVDANDSDALDLTFDDYRVTFESDGVLTADGLYYQATNTQTTDQAGQNTVIMDSLVYVFRSSENNVLAGNANTTYALSVATDSVITRSIEQGSYFIMSPPQEQSSFNVTTSKAFSTSGNNDDRYFSTGQLYMFSESDNSSLYLDVDNGDIDTVTITISNELGTSDPVTFPWSTWESSFRFQ